MLPGCAVQLELQSRAMDHRGKFGATYSSLIISEPASFLAIAHLPRDQLMQKLTFVRAKQQPWYDNEQIQGIIESWRKTSLSIMVAWNHLLWSLYEFGQHLEVLLALIPSQNGDCSRSSPGAWNCSLDSVALWTFRG